MSLIDIASKIEDTYELSDDQLDDICGGARTQDTYCGGFMSCGPWDGRSYTSYDFEADIAKSISGIS